MLLAFFNRFYNECYLGRYLLAFYKQNKET